MKKMLIAMLIILSINGSISLAEESQIDYKDKYLQQVQINIDIDKDNQKKALIIKDLEKKVAEIKRKYVFKIPFIDAGITIDHIQGAGTTLLILAIL